MTQSIKNIIAALNEYERHSELTEKIIAYFEKQRKQRLNKAISEHHHTTMLFGSASINTTSELQAKLSITIVPLGKRNANGQAVDITEATNILNSIAYMPVRANFDGSRLYGHAGATDRGVITAARNNNNVIVADAILWTEKDDGLIEYIAEKGEVQSSFELYYGSEEMRDGTQYLRDVVFASQCLVANPAYQGLTPARLM